MPEITPMHQIDVEKTFSLLPVPARKKTVEKGEKVSPKTKTRLRKILSSPTLLRFRKSASAQMQGSRRKER
jgi:hypothetical protein